MVEMKIQLNNAKIIDPQSSWHLKTCDLLIQDGIIAEIGAKLQHEDALQVSASELCVTPGFIDLKADFCDPGFEHKETIASGLDAASAGGYTRVYIQPNTQPVIDNKAVVSYIQQQGANSTTLIGVNGALSKGIHGEELAEMYELYEQGVRLFTDDSHSVSAGLLHRALLYTKDFGGRVALLARNASLSAKAQVNEGSASTRTGLKADPHVSEIIEIERNIRLLAYTGGKMHLSGISTAEGVALIRAAKNEGLDLTADVHLMNLCFTEAEMLGFDTRFKVLPVLRTSADQQALWKGVLDHTIDAIVSDHRPGDLEEKELEFDLAQFGAPQLETVFAALLSQHQDPTLPFLAALNAGPRKILGLAPSSIEVGAQAELTLFDPSVAYAPNMRPEQGRFSPFQGRSLQGQIIGIIRGAHASIAQH
jgi:dihydroorotase